MYDNQYIFTDRPSLCYTNQKVTGFSKSGDQATDILAYEIKILQQEYPQ